MRYLFLKYKSTRLATAGSFGLASVLVSIVFIPKYVIDIKNVVAVLIIIAIVFHTFAWLGKNPSRVSRRLIFECRITDSVGGR